LKLAKKRRNFSGRHEEKRKLRNKFRISRGGGRRRRKKRNFGRRHEEKRKLKKQIKKKKNGQKRIILSRL
jgi:hypothetical protein